MLEHYISLLPPDQTTWTTEEQTALADLQANAQAAQTALDDILGVSTQEHNRVNNNLATYVTNFIANLNTTTPVGTLTP